MLHKIHNELLQLARKGHDTWAGRVENIRKCITDLLSHNTMPLDNNDIDVLLNKLRKLRYNHFICNWKIDSHQKNELRKLDTYKFIKSDYRIEPHILHVRDKRYQRAPTELRISSHKLMIQIVIHFRLYIHCQKIFALLRCIGGDDEIFYCVNALFIRPEDFACPKTLPIGTGSQGHVQKHYNV